MGGSSSPVSTETIPKWMQPYLENTLKEGEDLYSSGGFSHVEGLTDEQKEGMALTKGGV